ncbi:MAG: hypothetical protein CVT79_08900 [Alphaproteobacteria bacterium HGW-Alphaproteobacteria-18]|nr:MAG: hypothetical protein CVT79_08900 [Alphaproteobacteria bacterium HGW-Alphaproteobacteria-18]
MLKTILGAEWTLEQELATTLDLVRRLAADSAGRLVTCLIITAVVAFTASVQLAILWALLVFMNEYGEFLLARRMRRTDLSVRGRLVTYFVHLWIGACLWTSICLLLWIPGDIIDKLTGGAILLGILINGSLSYNESRLQSIATCLPAIIGAAIMIVWAIFDPHLGEREKIVACAVLFTLVAYLATGAHKNVKTREILRALVTKTTRLAAEDPLTGLRNRRSFLDIVEAHAATGADYLIAFIDLDRFKPLNDEFGHALGDEVLRAVASRLEEHPFVLAAARLGGDEFAVLCAVPGEPGEAARQMSALHSGLSAPIRSEVGSVSVGASIGWGRSGVAGTRVSDVLHSADVAMRRAKVEHLGVVEFDPVADSAALTSSAIEIAFRHALATGRIRGALQPIVSVNDGRIVAMELLARWPKSGFPRDPAPQDFIPIAERLGLLNDILWSTLRQALPSLTGTSWLLAINVSPSQLISSQFLPKLSAIIAQHGIPPERIELEITEQVAFRNVDQNCAVLDKARALGFRVVLDDFGAGYSSLAMLDRLPLDKIKLDRAFVGELKDRTEIQKILKATVSLAHELGMVCSVEGIECAETAAMVAAFGCDQVQGYWIGMPELIEQAPVLLEIAS